MANKPRIFEDMSLIATILSFKVELVFIMLISLQEREGPIGEDECSAVIRKILGNTGIQ